MHLMLSLESGWNFDVICLKKVYSTTDIGRDMNMNMRIFKTALVSIIFILELSVFNKSCLELNFQAMTIISRVPCTTVFLRLRTSGFQY